MRVVAPSGVAPESAGYEPTVVAALPRRDAIIRQNRGGSTVNGESDG